MNAEIAKQWAEALLSRKYRQAREQLRRGDAFCCLGVLCNLHAQAHPEIAAQQRSTELYLNEPSFLPEAVKRWAGLNSTRGKFPRGGGYSTLAMSNDTGASFTQIAALIEKHAAEL